ncbi:MAG TPA: hypothetical protein VFE57_07765, partial [Cyclobacteriaceae bacterium]|nr:hypothetical protein [Cyclobacteriaceae bacterium]
MIRISFIVVVLLACCTISNAQKHGIGLRFGDPMGITYKNYLSKTRSVEFILGSASKNWHWDYYQGSFEHYSQFDNYQYRSHEVQSTLYLQARYLLNYDIQISGMVGKLDWYWGLGALLKSANVRYHYQDFSGTGPVLTDTKYDIDFGPEGIIGLEYKFEDVPLSIFGETSLMLELLDRPGAIRV